MKGTAPRRRANHASVVEVIGFDHFKRFSGAITVGCKDLAATQTWGECIVCIGPCLPRFLCFPSPPS